MIFWAKKKLFSSIAGFKMIAPHSVNRLWAGGSFYRPHLMALLDFYFFYYSQRLKWPVVSQLRSETVHPHGVLGGIILTPATSGSRPA